MLRTVLLWVLLELIAAVQVRAPGGELVLVSWARLAVSPVVALADLTGALVRDGWTGIADAAHLAADTRRLELELETARAFIRILEEDAAAQRELAALSDLVPELAPSAVPARTTYRNLDSGRMIVVLADARGVAPDTPALAAGGVIGRVVRCAGPRCWIELITHPVAAIAVQTTDGRLDALAIGGDAGDLEIQFVPRQASLLRGEELVTSGADGVYPPGLPVGQVTSVRERTGAFLDVRAAPSAAVATARAVVLLDGWGSTEPPGTSTP
jgi:rod shape-determining protein MreC